MFILMHPYMCMDKYMYICNVGREEIEEIKRHWKSFLNLSEKIAQRPEAKRSENEACSRARRQARSTGVHDVHRRGPVDRGKGTVDQHGRPTATSYSRLVPVDRSGRPTDAFCLF